MEIFVEDIVVNVYGEMMGILVEVVNEVEKSLKSGSGNSRGVSFSTMGVNGRYKESVVSEVNQNEEQVMEKMDFTTPYIIRNLSGQTCHIERVFSQSYINMGKTILNDPSQNKYVLKNN